MDKNILLAVVVSTVLIWVAFYLNDKYFGGGRSAPEHTETIATEDSVENSEGKAPGQEGSLIEDSTLWAEVDEKETKPRERDITVDTPLFHARFSTAGGVVTSLLLKEHQDGASPVEMVNDEGKEGMGTFNLALGDQEAPHLKGIFRYRRLGRWEHEFSKRYAPRASDGSLGAPFLIRKTYKFFPNDYMIELRIDLENSKNDYLPLDQAGYAYTVSYGPQIGPRFTRFNRKGGGEYRRYFAYLGGKRKEYTVKKKAKTVMVDAQVSWATINGKYFMVAAIPGAGRYRVGWKDGKGKGEGDIHRSELFLSRSVIKSSRNQDTFRFYIGPKDRKILTAYNRADENPLGFSDLNLDGAIAQGYMLGWLRTLLGFLLRMFYKIIPNYGIAIILTTILIKILLFPITRKSFESTGKLQAIQPKIRVIQEKYKGDYTKINQEMGILYKKEGVNPLGGCLPLLVQMPIFFAFYGLLNRTFALRNAAFIPGWINDLSSPESVWSFAPYTLPLLGWHDVRLLPLLYLGTQLLMNRFMQSPATGGGKQGSGTQTKMLTYGLPIVFFFVLYNMASGLLLYWTMTNLITAIQQWGVNKVYKR